MRRLFTITTGLLTGLFILGLNIHAADAKHVHHHHRAPSESSQAAAPSRRSSRFARLERELREQNDELYALRYERQALHERLERIARRKREEEARQDASESESAHHRHRRRHAEISSDSSQTDAEQTRHERRETERAERIHEEHLAEIAAYQAHMHSIRMHEIALAEAERQQHKDKPSVAVKVATDSGLPVWEGEAYAAQVPVRVVTVNLDDKRVKVSALLAQSGIGTSEQFAHMISRAHPYLAVTGTFFSLDNLRPVGDIVIDGSLVYFGGMGTALAIKPDNHADMITVPWGHHHDWSGYSTVVACGPRLLKDGQIVLDPAMEHFRDQHMLAPNSRIAVGITGHNQLVFCMTRVPIYLGRLAKIMRSLGCQQAMNLDAGTSTGFYCNGNMIAYPGRRLTNAIVVYTNRRDSTIGALPQTSPAQKPSVVAAAAIGQASQNAIPSVLALPDAHSLQAASASSVTNPQTFTAQIIASKR